MIYFYFISDSSLYNYADDNTLSYSGYDLDKIINTLEKLLLVKTQSKNISFNLNGNIIKTEDEVKLLGVTIDYELKYL
jgi:hypothetical protein